MKRPKVWNMKLHILLLCIMCLILTSISWFIRPLLAYILGPIMLAYVIYILVRMRNISHHMRGILGEISSQLDPAQQELIDHFPIPCVAVSRSREILWYSNTFQNEVLIRRELIGQYIDQLTNVQLEEFCQKENTIRIDERSYHVRGMHPGDVAIPTDVNLAVSASGKKREDFYLLYFIDVTEMERDALLYRQTRPSVMLIMLDNYNELVQKAKESEKSRILSAVDSLLEDFSNKMTNSFIKRYDGEQFMMVVEDQHLDKIIQSRFSILDEVRKIETGGLSVTLSIGIGRGEKTLAQSEASARQALDMALGRGGDQAAVKTGTLYEFYGGVSKGVEKRTKVKSRMVANALSELITNADKVLIMGHKFGDLDCVGASVGMATAVRSEGKKAFIVVDREKNLSKALIDMVISDEANRDLFIDPDEALFTITPHTLLIVCDTHTRNLVESQQVYERCKTVVVIDHHRKMVNHIDNAVIFYHEPYASSASEMVTELIQYMGDKCEITSVVAQALLAGIMLDTRSFAMRTGVRTFEAAAYLRRSGADTVVVRKMFSNSMDSYQRKSRIVANAQIYRSCAVAQSDFCSEDMRVIAPQAADELLSIDGVDASFVIYENSGVIYISARSMGIINVQLIMEKMGGGGHQTMAATQLKGVEMEKAKQLLFESIDDYYTTH